VNLPHASSSVYQTWQVDHFLWHLLISGNDLVLHNFQGEQTPSLPSNTSTLYKQTKSIEETYLAENDSSFVEKKVFPYKCYSQVRTFNNKISFSNERKCSQNLWNSEDMTYLLWILHFVNEESEYDRVWISSTKFQSQPVYTSWKLGTKVFTSSFLQRVDSHQKEESLLNAYLALFLSFTHWVLEKLNGEQVGKLAKKNGCIWLKSFTGIIST
jgi:hypothetical protein